MNVNIEGIVLKQAQYKEKDCMVSVLTKDGLISFLARGILSPTSKNASACLLYNHSEFSLNEKEGKYTLTQSKVIHTFKNLYEKLDNVSCVSLMSETTLKFIDDEYQNLYTYFKNILYSLENGFDSATLLAIYLAQIIKQTGYELDYNNCVLCGNKKDIVAISYEDGGFICKNCLNSSHKLASVSLLKSFRYVFMIEANNIEHYVLDRNDSLNLICNFSRYLCDSFGERELKSLEMYLL